MDSGVVVRGGSDEVPSGGSGAPSGAPCRTSCRGTRYGGQRGRHGRGAPSGWAPVTAAGGTPAQATLPATVTWRRARHWASVAGGGGDGPALSVLFEGVPDSGADTGLAHEAGIRQPSKSKYFHANTHEMSTSLLGSLHVKESIS